MAELFGRPSGSFVGAESPAGLTGLRLGAAVDNYQANLYGLGEAITGSDWLRKQREENEREAEIASLRAQRNGAVDQWKDVHGVGDAANWLGGIAAQTAPYLAEQAAWTAADAASGGSLTPAHLARLGALAPKVLGGGGLRAGASMAERAAAESAGRGMARVAGNPFGYADAAGDILSNQREALRGRGEDESNVNLGAALAGAVPYRMLDMFEPTHQLAAGRLPSRLGLTSLDALQGMRGGAARLGVNALKSGAIEGFNEAGQEVINQGFGRMATDPRATLTDPDALDRYKESFIGGAALGGISGGMGGGWRRSEGYQARKAAEVESGKPTNLMDAAPRPEFGLQSYGQSDGPTYENPFARLDRVNGDKTGQAVWGYEPGATGDLFVPSYPHGYQATRSEDGTNRNLMSGVYTDVNGQPVELTSDELRHNQMPFIAPTNPDWTTSLGAGVPRQGGLDAAGLTPALGDPRVSTGTSPLGPQLQMPLVPGRPGLDDVMLAGPAAATGRVGPGGPNGPLFSPAGGGNVAANGQLGQVDLGLQEAMRKAEEVRAKAEEADRVKREAQAAYDRKLQGVHSAVFTSTEMQRGAHTKLDPKVVQAVAAMNEAPVDAAVKAKVVGQLRAALTTNDKQQINAAVREVNSVTKAAVKDAEKLAAAQAAMAQTTPNKPYTPSNAKVVQPKTAPANKAAAETSEKPADAPAATPASGKTVEAAAPAAQPASPSSPAAAPTPVVTKKPRLVVGMTAAQAAKPGEDVKATEVTSVEKTAKDQAKAELSDAASRLKDFFTKPKDPFEGITELHAGVAIPTEMREILVDLAKAAMKLGYHSVKDAVAHMRKSIIEMVGKEASDRIADEHLIAARQEAGKYSPNGKAVYGGRVDLAMLHVAMEGRPDLEKAVRYYLLVDDDGTHLPAKEVPTLTAAAQKAGLGNSDHAQLSRINKLLGLTDSVIRRMRLDHYDETPFGEYGHEFDPENEIESETNQVGVQQGFREGALALHDDEFEDYDGGELDGVDDATRSAVEARLMGVAPKASKSSVGHSTVDGLVQKTFGTVSNKWFKPFYELGGTKLKPLADVKDGDLGAALTALYSYVMPDSLQPRASKAMKEAAAKNQSLLNDLLTELKRRQEVGSFDNKKVTRTLESRGEMVKAKAETSAQQAERERKKAQAEKDKEDRNAQQRDEYGREADPVDRREGDERLVPDLTGLDELPETSTSGPVDGEGPGAAEEAQGGVGETPVTIVVGGDTVEYKSPKTAMELIQNKVEALTELLNCLRG